MRRSISLVAAILAVSLLGCTSGDAITIEVLLGEEAIQDGEQVVDSIPFRATGSAIDKAAVCEIGTVRQDHLESPEGVAITPEAGAKMYEAARADNGTMDLYRVQDFVCDDASGTFTMKVHSRVDFAKSDTEQDSPTWKIESGTGDYASLSGSGEAFADFGASPDEAVLSYDGEVRPG